MSKFAPAEFERRRELAEQFAQTVGDLFAHTSERTTTEAFADAFGEQATAPEKEPNP